MSIVDFMKRWLSGANLDQTLLTLLIISLPFERIPSADLGIITIRPSLVVGGLVILRAVYILVSNRRIPTLIWPERLLAAFAIWIIVLIPFALNSSRAAQVVVFDLFALSIAIAVRILFRREYLRGLTHALIYVSIGICIFGLYQYFGDIFGLKPSQTGLRERYSWAVFGFPRIQGASLEPLYFASLLMLPASVLCALILNYGWRKLYAVGLALVSLNIFLTVSRGGTFAFLILFIGVILYAVVKRHITRGLMIVLLVVIMYALALFIISKLNKPIQFGPSHQKTSIGTYAKQISNTGLEGSGDERARSRALALKIAMANPVVGIGPGNFGVAVQGNERPAMGWAIVNNETLELWAETGLIGLGLIVAAFGWMLVSAGRLVRQASDPLILSWLIGLIGFLVATAVQYQTFSTLYITHIWVAVGILLGLLQLSAKNSTRTSRTL